MDDEKMIREQMEETRTSMTEKLETLENKVADTVQEATSAVSETVTTVKDSIQDTVAAVTGTVQDTVTTVKDTLHEGVESVKSMFDVPHLVEQHPWSAVACSLAVGFCLERTFGKAKAASMTEKMSEASAPTPGQPTFPGAAFQGAAALQSRQGKGHHGSNGGHHGHAKHGHAARDKPASKSIWGLLGPELEALKGLALGAMFGMAREMLVKAVPPEMGERLKDIMDNVTTKLGGKPFEKPFGDQPGAEEATEGQGREQKAGLGLGRERSDWQRGDWQRE